MTETAKAKVYEIETTRIDFLDEGGAVRVTYLLELRPKGTHIGLATRESYEAAVARLKAMAEADGCTIKVSEYVNKVRR